MALPAGEDHDPCQRAGTNDSRRHPPDEPIVSVRGPLLWGSGGAVMRHLLLWIAAPLLLLAAAMLIAGAGAPAWWIALPAVGIVLVVFSRVRPNTTTQR